MHPRYSRPLATTLKCERAAVSENNVAAGGRGGPIALLMNNHEKLGDNDRRIRTPHARLTMSSSRPAEKKNHVFVFVLKVMNQCRSTS